MIEFFLDLVFDAMNIFKHLFDIMDCEFDGFIVIWLHQLIFISNLTRS